jgi:hypothetical protein
MLLFKQMETKITPNFDPHAKAIDAMHGITQPGPMVDRDFHLTGRERTLAHKERDARRLGTQAVTFELAGNHSKLPGEEIKSGDTTYVSFGGGNKYMPVSRDEISNHPQGRHKKE